MLRLDKSLYPCGKAFGKTTFSHQIPTHSCSYIPQSTLLSGPEDVNFHEAHTQAGEPSSQTVATFWHAGVRAAEKKWT